MKQQEKDRIFAQALQRWGGSWAAAMGSAYLKADNLNRGRMRKAFPDLLEKYGPGSHWFCTIQNEEEAREKGCAEAWANVATCDTSTLLKEMINHPLSQ